MRPEHMQRVQGARQEAGPAHSRMQAVVGPLAHEPRPVIVDTPRGPVEYAESGQGPAVLALHGAMGGWDQGLILARTIGAQGYRYLAVSRPGYLGTPLDSGRTSEAQADLCAALLDALGIRAAVAMAVSGGGPCALHLALRHPQRCRGLVLVSTCAGIIDTPLPLAFQVTKFLARWPAFGRLVHRKVLRDPERAARRSIPDPDLRARTLRDPETGPLFTALLASTSERMALRLSGTENDIAVTRGTTYPLEKITAPVLIVHGTADSVVPFARHAKALESRIPAAELLAVEGGEHVSIFTHREEVRARVDGFLAAHAPAAG